MKQPQNTKKATVAKEKKSVTSKKASAENRGAAPLVIDVSAKTNFTSALQLIKRGLSPALKEPMPQNLKPMLSGIAAEPFNAAGWQFEIKWDGYRALSYLKRGSVELKSRNNLSFHEKFSAVTEALMDWGINAVVDGEIVVLNEEGHADFEALQGWKVAQKGTLVYFVFDLLWLDGYNLMSLPLMKRREILIKLMPQNGVIRFSDSIDEAGIDFFKVAQQNGLEGIIAKQKEAPYITATRTKSWLKIKAEERHEAVICGYTKNKDTDRLFSSLVLGLPGKNGLQFIGQVGTGFTAAVQKSLFKKMNPLFSKECPFEKVPNTGAPTMWVTPYLVCEVKYTELTKEGVMRHPSFQGLREDKTIADLNTEESAVATTEKPIKKEPQKTGKKKAEKVAEKGSETIDFSKSEAVVTIDGQNLKFTNLQKVYWPIGHIKKGDLLEYYHEIAPYILPYMKDRPQSLNRHPNGIEGKNFYHKDMNGKVESWLTTHRRFSDSTNENKEFLVCTSEASLLYMANLGCIEMNPWHSRIQLPDNPDWCVIDLDPGTNTFEQVIDTALVVKSVLDQFGVTSFVKTSGSTGLHIYVPFGARYTYDQSKQFAEIIVHLVHDQLPLITSLERSPLKRPDKIYLDYLQNRPIQTICAPYSCRPKPGATVSAPLHWSEVKKGLQINQFTIKNMLQRVKSEGDLFTGVLAKGIDLEKILAQLMQAA